MSPDIEKIRTESQEWLKENTKRYAFKKLEKDIIVPGVCVECGTCVSNCPVNVISAERIDGKYTPTLTGKCTACGICYAMCPRTLMLPEDLIGSYKAIWKARSTLDQMRKQDGGVVTALLASEIRRGKIQAAVVASQGEDLWLPKASVATDEASILSSGGTIYTHSPIAEGMMSAFEKGYAKLGIVGTSCNIDAISKLKLHPAGFLNLAKDAEVLKIGLFCMESFDYLGLKGFLKENDIAIEKVTRMSIAGGKFTVHYNDLEKEWPIAELNHIATRSCSYCHDLTSKNSDISCGNIGSEANWTTVIVRTERGAEAFNAALKAGIIEAEELDENGVQAVQNTARSKGTRYYKMEPAH